MGETVVEKRKVTMTNAIATPDGVMTHEAVDYVPVDLLDAYLADAHSRWQSVVVGPDEHDPGPGGDDGQTTYLAHLDHPLAGQVVNALPEPKPHTYTTVAQETAKLKRSR